MGWLITLGVLILIGLIPVGVGVRYREEVLKLKVSVAWIPIPIDLKKLMQKKEKPTKKKEPIRPEDQPVNPNAPKKQEKKTSLQELLPLIRIAVQMLGALRRKLVVDRLELKLILAGDDPCDLAILYGNTWAAVGNLMAQLENGLTIRRRDIQIECDFTADKTIAAGRLDLHLTFGRMLGLIVTYGFKAVVQLLSAKKRKGGA